MVSIQEYENILLPPIPASACKPLEGLEKLFMDPNTPSIFNRKWKKNSYSAKAQYNISCSYPQLLSVPSDTESNCQCFEDERAATLPPNVEGKIKLYKYFAWSQAKYFQGM